MPLKYNHTMQSAGEVFSIELIQTNPQTGEPAHTPEEMDSLMDQALLVMDKRKFEMNMRVLEAYGLINFLSDAEKVKFKALLQVLSGDITPAYLRERWEAAQEETAELEAARAKAHEAALEEAAYYRVLAEKGECTCSRILCAVECPIHENPELLVKDTIYDACGDCGMYHGQHAAYCSKTIQ